MSKVQLFVELDVKKNRFAFLENLWVKKVVVYF